MELETEGEGGEGGRGERHSLMLQNAETVKLVGPTESKSSRQYQQPLPQLDRGELKDRPPPPAAGGGKAGQGGFGQGGSGLVATAGAGAGWGGGEVPGADSGWRSISVSQLQPGDEVYVMLQSPGRHTGIAVQEFILEK